MLDIGVTKCSLPPDKLPHVSSPWYGQSDRDCMSPTPTSKVPFQPLATVTSPPAQTSVRRRMSFSLSPSSLRAATQSTAESDDPSPNSRGKVLPNKGSRGEGDHRGGGNKRMSRRGRSMSIAFGSSVASRRNIDSKFAVSGEKRKRIRGYDKRT